MESNKIRHKCLYNHELLIAFSSQTPYQSYKENVARKQFEGLVKEVGGTRVDAFMCCPTAWRLPLYFSEVNRIWQDKAPNHHDPLPEDDWKYFDKTFSRIKRYMLNDNYEDPVQITLDTVKKNGMDFFISYRMNDHHYTYYNGDRISPTMDPLWTENPDLRIGNGNGHNLLNYLKPKVREWYFNILRELAEQYDIDGMELDFMRHHCFFRPEDVAEGLEVMTGFVKKLRVFLNQLALQRGKPIPLCVRIPRNLDLCKEFGLDIITWDREGLIDMCNASTYFRNSPEIDLEGFKSALSNSSIYGEMHFALGGTKPRHYFSGSSNRLTTGRMYKTTAFNFLDRGADGLSFFNFAYTRDHQFNEPRRRMIQNVEPPFEILKNILDTAYLAQQEKHYVTISGFDLLPRKLISKEPLEFDIYIADKFDEPLFKEAVLRLEIEVEKFFIIEAIDVLINETELKQIPGSGELFRPLSQEALPMPEELLFYIVPLNKLKNGINKLKIVSKKNGEFFRMSNPKLTGIELALYKHKRE